MLIVGFRGSQPDSVRHVAELLKKGLIGGVILFDYDVERKSPVRNIISRGQLGGLVTFLRSQSQLTPFIAIDQEGGKVNRLKEKFGFPPTVSQAYIGNVDHLDTTAKYAERTAMILRSLGINLNFAPVVDVNRNSANPVIGKLERSYSSRWKAVAAHAIATIEMFHRYGILSAVKHFPGHGSSTADSHEGFVDVTHQWSREELHPYYHLIQDTICDMVMTAHVFNENLDPEWPATLSRRTISGVLRDSLRWGGVVISDDMQMKAITTGYGLETAIERAIDAGVDILLFGNNAGVYDERIAEKAHRIILRLVQDGRISRQRIEQSYQRILKLKSRLR